MGTWISHLRIAENLLPHLPEVEPAAFIFGSLAPDSGLPNTDWTDFNPPKTVTHFLNAGEGEGCIRDMEFYRGYLAGLTPDGDKTAYSLRLGFFFHLVCDNLSALQIGMQTKSLYAGLFEELGAVAAWDKVKADWYGLDHLYLEEHPESSFFSIYLRETTPQLGLPFIPQAAYEYMTGYIREYYSPPPAKINLERPFPYLNKAAMNRQIHLISTALIGLAEKMRAGAFPPAEQTCLALMPEEMRQPIPPPLGDTLA